MVNESEILEKSLMLNNCNNGTNPDEYYKGKRGITSVY